jgi:hypothetical protein
MVDTFFEDLVRDKSFIEICNSLRLHALRHDQQNKVVVTRQIHNTYQSSSTGTTKKFEIENFLTLINELQVQDPDGSDDELNTPTLSENEIMCKSAQVLVFPS